ncbi:MAG TPA: ATP-binding protein [Thermoanaerobaculia bacterium]|nr:ATP-binding protein [Thermoanaerobaculia bacterium]
MPDFEKLGVFYLGKAYDPAKKQRRDDLVLYDSRDLVTHAVCVGMTGSGKTGLCLSLIEEAAIDGVPAILIDPKGDLCNLLLSFPNLAPEDFRPWINEDEAARKGVSPDDYARDQAALWKKGLAEWGEDGARIQRLRDAADFAIYTPGSKAGLPVSILRSFSAPPPSARDDEEALRDRVASTATGLLALLGVDVDPLQSREHILLSTILAEAWKNGEDLDLAALIARLQTPPVARVGVVELESFFPAKERFAFAMRVNGLLAAPGFAAWLEGEPLEVGGLLRTASGKPRVAIFSIAHLSDAERMFFVTLLLNQTLAWMRAQTGTTSLRAVLYMDEIAGYFPPVANPPAKTPLLTLLKQGRAFGLGVVLATQNPVDLDYKGLSNAGTWFLGRLQTERDKARVLEGLEGAAAGAAQKFDRGGMERLLAGLGNRVFLLNNVHEDAPELFETRWALSYLRGPLTRAQIKTLMDPRRGETPAAGPGKPAASSSSPASSARPVLPPAIPQGFAPVRGSGAGLVYRPALLAVAEAHFADGKLGVATTETVARLAPPGDDVVWSSAEEPAFPVGDLEADAEKGAGFAALPASAGVAKNYDRWGKDFATWIYRERALTLWRSPSSGEISKAGESEGDFRARLQQGARERRDAAADALRQKYAPRLAALQERLRRAQQTVEREKQQATQSGVQTAISVGATVLAALLGRKSLSARTLGRATTAARGAGRTIQQAGDVGRAEESAAAIEQQIRDLDAGVQAELAASAAATDPAAEKFEVLTLRPKKSDVTVRRVTLVWLPYRGDEPAFG